MAEPIRASGSPASRFARAAFEARLATQWLGRDLKLLAETPSTNDAAWASLAAGAADGSVVVADHQTRGRGRAGRTWHTAPGRGLALSVLFHHGVKGRPLGIIPLAAGLALARGLECLGATARLKWPNDLLLGDRKLAGILAESRPGPARASAGSLAVVIGVGVNVGELAGDFPSELDAASLALAGFTIAREAVAAEFLNALEPLWVALEQESGAAVLEAWRKRADFWGERVRVRTPLGLVDGVACGVDQDGGLLLERPDGTRMTVVAGDLEVEAAGDPSRR